MYKKIRKNNILTGRFPYTTTFMDLETTSLDINEARIIQFSSKTFNYEPDVVFPNSYDTKADGYDDNVNVLDYIINPSVYVKNKIVELTGIKRENIEVAPKLKEVADKIHDTILNTEYLITYNGLKFDLPVLQNNLMRAYRPMNYKKSKHHKNKPVRFIDLLDVVKSEICSPVFEWCKDVNREPNLKLNTVFDFITASYEDALGVTLPELDTSFHNAMFDVNATIRVFSGLITLFNVNLLDYVTTFMNLPEYKLTLEEDSKLVVTNIGKYANFTLEELTQDKNEKGQEWLIQQHNWGNITLSDELLLELQPVN